MKNQNPKVNHAVKQTAKAKLPTKFGNFIIRIFTEEDTGVMHSVLTCGDIHEPEAPLTRIHSECLTGDIFASLRCDCGKQLHKSMKEISKEGSGILIRMNTHEGRGIGLNAKIQSYQVQDEKGLDTVEANHYLGFGDDLRDYAVTANILKKLGVLKIRLMTNNPLKISEITKHGIEVVDRIPVIVEYSVENKKYMKAKREKMNHIL